DDDAVADPDRTASGCAVRGQLKLVLQREALERGRREERIHEAELAKHRRAGAREHAVAVQPEVRVELRAGLGEGPRARRRALERKRPRRTRGVLERLADKEIPVVADLVGDSRKAPQRERQYRQPEESRE